MNKVKFLQKWFFDIDKFTLFFAFFLIFIGTLMSLSIDPAISNRIHISKYHFTKNYIFFSNVGLFAMLFCSMMSKKAILNCSCIGYIICIFLLLVILLTGYQIKGAKRWLNLGFFALQPSELIKPFFIIVNAHLLSVSKNNKIIPLFAIINFGFLSFFFISQPDFGTTILYGFIWVIQIFLGNSSINILIYSIIPLCIVVAILGFFFFPHFHNRIINYIFFRSGTENYQTKKAIESIYNGGYFGTGLAEGKVKYQLPDSHTDYIFSVICEEFGVIFAIIIITMIIFFVYHHLSSNYRNMKYEIRVIYGLVLSFAMQCFIHIGVNINILPSKGITLPFISYGGSSIISNSIIFGFLLAFTRKSYDYQSEYKFIDFKRTKYERVV